MKHTRTAGFSVVELLVVASILSVMLGVPLMMFRSADRMQSSVTTRLELQARVHQTVDRIASRLEGSSISKIPQSGLAAGTSTPIIDFQVALDWNGATVDWAPPERIALLPSPEDPDDGVDNDSDGLIDEKVVVWTSDVGLPSELSMVLRRNVPKHLAGEIAGNAVDENGNGLLNEGGLAFEFVADQVVVRLSLQGRDESGAAIEIGEERRVAFRN